MVEPAGKVFRRLLRLLRPYYPMLALGILLLVGGTPCELFLALVWKYVTDDLILRGLEAQRLVRAASKIPPVARNFGAIPAL